MGGNRKTDLPVAIYDDIFTMSTEKDRAKVRAWFAAVPSAQGTANTPCFPNCICERCKRWSHGSLTAQLGPRRSSIEAQPGGNRSSLSLDSMDRDLADTAMKCRVFDIVPLFEDTDVEQRLEQAIAEIAALTAERNRLSAMIEASCFEERLSSSWEHLPCVTTGLSRPVSEQEARIVNAIRGSEPALPWRLR